MRDLDPPIEETHYVLEALDALEMLLPEDAPAYHLCFAVIAALWRRIDGGTLRLSDLRNLQAEFAAGVNKAAALTSSTLANGTIQGE